MGTDAGAGTSEKAHIGGRTSLTQLDTWLETMDGETLCLTGKVTDCWQPVDGAQENASFYLKDLSIEADASSFVFSGDSAEMTDNLSQISGSADAEWNTLTEAMEEDIIGKGILNDACSGVSIVNEMDVPVLAMGLHDVVISASPEGILVSDKEQSSYIKPFVDMFEQQIMFAEKSWGSFKVVDVESTSMTIKVTLNAGHKMNYHSHKNRDEVWVVISGTGKTIVDGMEQNVKAGDVITMSAGCRHTVIAESELKLIEVQLGEDINVHDKQKYELEY